MDLWFILSTNIIYLLILTSIFNFDEILEGETGAPSNTAIF